MQKHLHIIQRAEAKRLGMGRYFTGKPCKSGHISERYTGCGKCFSCQKKYEQRYREKNRDAWLERMRVYHKRNRDTILARQREYYRDNSEKIKDSTSKYFKQNPESKRASERKRRLAKVGIKTFTKVDESKMLELQKNKCASCFKLVGGDGLKYHVDHIMPIALGGDNRPENLQILCADCNMRKSSRDPFEWAKINGRLL